MCITCEEEILGRTTAVGLSVVDIIAPSKFVFRIQTVVSNGIMHNAISNDVEDVMK